ncbi:MAG: L,D-transpeptidase family protein [Pseudomonadota bacterium]
MTPQDLVLTPRGLRFRGLTYPCVIGRGGVRDDKREGDGGTPLGLHRIVDLYYRPDRMAPPNAWAKPIRPGDLWSDDPAQADYNHPVRQPYCGSHEVMRRADPMYDLVLITDWNYPNAVSGRGSCIFLHQWRRPGYPTAGCVAFRRDHLRAIAARLMPGDRLIVPHLRAGPRHAGPSHAPR